MITTSTTYMPSTLTVKQVKDLIKSSKLPATYLANGVKRPDLDARIWNNALQELLQKVEELDSKA